MVLSNFVAPAIALHSRFQADRGVLSHLSSIDGEAVKEGMASAKSKFAIF
jgi:hypothetical protein